MLPKVKPWRCAAYRRFVSSLNCCVTGAPGPNDPHHYQRPGQGGVSTKVGDEQCVPLNHHSHERVHKFGRGLWEAWRVDPEAVIVATQEAWFVRFKTRPWLAR